MTSDNGKVTVRTFAILKSYRKEEVTVRTFAILKSYRKEVGIRSPIFSILPQHKHVALKV